jgi:predicted Zn-dependent peptidase
MVDFKRFTLDNGLKVILHHDPFTPIAAVNILYNVGARDEDPQRTGFAHLFEHLMFGGSVNIPKYDTPLERAGGENNAFTNSDITNYYLTLPGQNLETALWLESDRMLSLAFSEQSLDVQRNVVVEEFKQSYLNQPYGDVWLLLRPLAYTVHPYCWDTIGKDISHVRNATMAEVKDFYRRFYHPGNAIIVIAGDLDFDAVTGQLNEWFGSIPAGNGHVRNLPVEPLQEAARMLTVERDVPFDAIYKVYHMCGREDRDYPATDLLSDILSNGTSSRLYRRLVKEKKLFSELNAFITGDQDPGLFVFSGKLIRGVRMKVAEKALLDEMDQLRLQPPREEELEKVKNKIESTLEFSEMNVLNKAMNLAYYELLGDANLLNMEAGRYRAVTGTQVRDVAAGIFRDENSTTLYYHAKQAG